VWKRPSIWCIPLLRPLSAAWLANDFTDFAGRDEDEFASLEATEYLVHTAAPAFVCRLVGQ
ncbi:hypothetical protein, partial [Aquitalea magnusonii]|uniref:hypothetical protein n=1 Tax=Aquitalea magnusonii TaxID=332411 RepID=UPI00195CCFA1